MKTEREAFRKELLREINECRMFPSEYAKKIEDHLRYIKDNPEPKAGSSAFYDLGDGWPKISLYEGIERFYECINYLKEINSMSALKFDPELVVNVPKASSKWTNRDEIADLLGEKKAKLADKYTDYNFQFDVGVDHPEVCAIMQIVDDNIMYKGSRRESLLNPHTSRIGVSNQKNGNKVCVYVLLANHT